jgi:hypothetical protein
MAPAGTPREIVARLNAAINEAVRDPQMRELAPKLGFTLDRTVRARRSTPQNSSRHSSRCGKPPPGNSASSRNERARRVLRGEFDLH